MARAVPLGKLTALRRSAVMISPTASIPLERDELVALGDEILATRQLLTGLGDDLRAIAANAPHPNPPR